jgi:hypothetical protein
MELELDQTKERNLIIFYRDQLLHYGLYDFFMLWFKHSSGKPTRNMICGGAALNWVQRHDGDVSRTRGTPPANKHDP